MGAALRQTHVICTDGTNYQYHVEVLALLWGDNIGDSGGTYVWRPAVLWQKDHRAQHSTPADHHSNVKSNIPRQFGPRMWVRACDGVHSTRFCEDTFLQASL